MIDDISNRLKAIERMPCTELRQLWRETFHEEPRSGNVQWMRRRLCWGLQAQVLGGLSEAAKKRIEELTPVALASMPWGLRSFPDRNEPVSPPARDRLAPGTIVTRKYLGRVLQLLVREDGTFELDGVIYPSLTAAATGATKSHWNGTLFWLGRNGKRKLA